MENVLWLNAFSQRKGNPLWFSVCPMVLNAYEMPGLIDFATGKGIGVYFNTVTEPKHLSLKNLPKQELKNLIAFYKQELKQSGGIIGTNNYHTMQGLINQLQFWAA